MTNDSNPLQPVQNKQMSSPEHQRLLPILRLDVGEVDQAYINEISKSEALQETLFVFYYLLYEKVCNIEKNFGKQVIVFQKTCQKLGLSHALALFPQIDTIKASKPRYCIFLEELISRISLEVDSKHKAILPSTDDLGLPFKSKRRNEMHRLNTHHHKILNSTSRNRDANDRLNDFINYGLIEKGGFGRVYKMQNKTDRCFYAIKCICFKTRNQSKAAKIMSEVILFANLPSHQNIVSYKGSWLEHDIMDSKECGQGTEDLGSSSSTTQSTTEFHVEFIDDDPSSSKTPSTQSTPSTPTTPSTSSTSSSPPFKQQSLQSTNSPNSSKEYSADEQACASPKSLSRPLTETSIEPESQYSSEFSIVFTSEASNEPSTSSHQPSTKDLPDKKEDDTDSPKALLHYCTLYIQMELCSWNLRSWLNRRNDMYTKNKVINMEKSVDVFIQILRGVAHLHEHNLIHRDLKPQNILFTNKNVVKIADFGLTTLETNCEMDSHSEKARKLTQGLGTLTYAAPEQLKSTSYDHKADIYSLGLILFELLCPFSTDMEKADLFDQLKNKHELPDSVVKYGPLSQAVTQTVRDDPKSRPEASELLEFELLFRCSTQQEEQDEVTYEDLINMCDHLRLELTAMEKIIKSKDEEIAGLKEQIKNLKQRGG